VTAIQPDAVTTMAIHKATGLTVLQARDFIMASAPELIQRILDGRRVRHLMRLGTLPKEVVGRILEASESQSNDSFLHDPVEDDPEAGPTVRQTLKQVSQELEAIHGRRMGLCHLIWRTTQDRLLQEHAIVWYSPAQMNPGSCFD
jgi:hypothetical protein